MNPLHSVLVGDSRKRQTRRRRDAVVAVIDQLEHRVFLSGTLTPIATFNGVDGATPNAVVEDSSGNLFGIAEATYASVNANPGPGVLFEVPANTGTIEDLYAFGDQNGGDVVPSPSSLIIDSSGNLYGASPSAIHGMPGTVIEFPVGTTTPITLATFATTDSEQVTAIDSAGNLYGIDNGTAVFEVVANSGMVTPLGDAPDQLQQTIVDLQLGPDGNLYGVSDLGGDTNADLFEITPSNGNLQILAAFDPTTSGYTPVGLTFDSNGNIWGFCQQGGPTGAGTVWEFPLPVTSATPTIAFVATFTQAGGFTITCRPAFGTSGNLYGLTEDGGANGNGTAFALQPGATTLTDIYDFGPNASDPEEPEGSIANSSGFVQDTVATAATTLTGEDALLGNHITPESNTDGNLTRRYEIFVNRNITTGNSVTVFSGSAADIIFGPDVGPPSPTQLRNRETIEQKARDFEEETERQDQLDGFDFALAGNGFNLGGGLSIHVGKLADAPVGTGTSLSSQLASINEMLVQTGKELGAAGPLIGKYTAVDGQYTKEGTTIAALDAQLAAQTNPAKQAAIQKKITADQAVQAALLTQDDADGTAASNQLDEIDTLEANITAAFAALPAPFAELTGGITSVPALINPGKRATAVLTVTNSGNVPTTLSFQMMLFARPQGTTGSADVTLATDTIKLHRLKPNVPIPARLSFLIPKTFAAGTYSLVAVPVISSTLTGTATSVVSTTTFTVP